MEPLIFINDRLASIHADRTIVLAALILLTSRYLWPIAAERGDCPHSRIAITCYRL
jgi:hypothetical protein